MKDTEQTIGMLLDVENYSGEHEGRLGPLVTTLLLITTPVAVYIYLGLHTVIPVWISLPVWIYFSLRVTLVILGREKYRLSMFKRQLNDEYITSASLLGIRKIYPNGCVEYEDGSIHYFILAYNGTVSDKVQHTVQLHKFIKDLTQNYDFDIYVLNDVVASKLTSYYSKANTFKRNESAKNFIDIIDYARDITKEGSLIQGVLYVIKGYKSDWKNMEEQIDTVINSEPAKVYKHLHRVVDEEEINVVINRDTDTAVNIPSLLREKYKTTNYETSRVVAYDADENELILGKRKEMEVPSVSQDFHVIYKE